MNGHQSQRTSPSTVSYKKIRTQLFFKSRIQCIFFVFNFENFILYVELIVLQSSFIRIKKKNAEKFFLIKKETKVFGFFCRILYVEMKSKHDVRMPERSNFSRFNLKLNFFFSVITISTKMTRGTTRVHSTHQTIRYHTFSSAFLWHYVS
jgi:hypothetical protein